MAGSGALGNRIDRWIGACDGNPISIQVGLQGIEKNNRLHRFRSDAAPLLPPSTPQIETRKKTEKLIRKQPLRGDSPRFFGGMRGDCPRFPPVFSDRKPLI